MYVQLGENKPRPTPTGNTMIRQNSTNVFVGNCLCYVNWPLYYGSGSFIVVGCKDLCNKSNKVRRDMELSCGRQT